MIPCPACKTELDPKTDRSPRDGRFCCWRCGVTVAEPEPKPITINDLTRSTEPELKAIGGNLGDFVTSANNGHFFPVCQGCRMHFRGAQSARYCSVCLTANGGSIKTP
jgi:hypothetical protein